MKTVLVTGANGQLGKCIQKIAANYTDIKFHFKTSSELDITNTNAVEKYLKEQHISHVVNCAAYTNVELAESEAEKAFLVNSEAVLGIAKACKETNITLLHVSTDYVFDGNTEVSYKEDATTNPINVYGASKLKGEQHIQEVLENYFIIRTSWLYSEFGKNFYNTILQKAKEKADLTITTEQKGTPTNANDLAEVLLQIIDKNSTDYGIYHFSNLGVATWFDFAKEIITNLNLPESEQPSLASVATYKTKAARPIYSVLDKSKILQFTSLLSWQDSLKNIMKLNI